MADLYRVITDLIAKYQRRSAGGEGGAELYQPGVVLAINADGTYEVDMRGRRVTANPETDLPLTVGQPVFISPVKNGRPVVHGPR